MPAAHTDHGPSTPSKKAHPDLPQGWRYSDDQDWDELQARSRRRRLALGLLVAVLVLCALVALAVLNAQGHYSRGVAALQAHDYALAATELSGATLYVLPYRDASLLADDARRQAEVTYGEREAAAQRVKDAHAALRQASAALRSAGAPAVLAALQTVEADDLQAAVQDDADVAAKVQSLGHDIGAAAGQALKKLEWQRAEILAAALAVLDPKSEAAASLASKATQGQALTEKLAEARDAAHHGEWRKALRLALAVAAAQRGFPGAASVVAEARTALKPKPKAPAAAATSTAATSGSGTSSGTSSGSSSGSSSQPPPP